MSVVARIYPIASAGCASATLIGSIPVTVSQSRNKKFRILKLDEYIYAHHLIKFSAAGSQLAYQFSLSSTISPVSKPPISAACLAALMIFAAVDSPISAVFASSAGDANATASMVLIRLL
jgi:hypothetical protein